MSAIRVTTSRRSSGSHPLEIEVRDLAPVQVLERQDPRRGVRADHSRDDDVRIAREVLVEHLGVPRLVAVVELEPDGARELVDELAGIDEVERAHALVQELRRLVEEREVRLDLSGSGGSLHLDGDLSPVGQHRSVHLPDRRRCHRHDVELEERPLHGQVELGLEDVANVVEAHRSRRVLEAAKLRDDVGRHDVRPRREQLPELHERRPELVEHLAEPPSALRLALLELPALPARKQVADPVLAERVAEAVPGGHLRDLGETAEAPRRLHLWSGHPPIVRRRPAALARTSARAASDGARAARP